MQRNTFFLKIFAIIFLIMGCFSSVSFAQVQPNSVYGQIKTLLDPEQILDVLQKNQLSELFSQMDLSKQKDLDLIYLQDLLWEKIYQDTDDLQMLVENLTLLQKSKITYQLGRINKGEFKQLLQKFDNLSRYVDFRSQEIELSENLTKEDFFRFLAEDSSILDGEGKSVLSMWTDFKDKVSVHYPSWSKRYFELDQRVDKKKDPLMESAKILSFDEMEFYEGFGEVQIYLRKHSGANSSDF